MAGAAARRYARAIFELARDDAQFEEWTVRITAVREVLSVPEVGAVLVNPTISRQERQAAVSTFLEGADPEGVNLAKLLVGAGKVEEISAIEDEYGRLVDEAAGRVRATATTAVELSPNERDGLARSLSKRLGREVRLTAAVDPAIIGGLVVRFGDHVIDASLATRLQQLRRKLAGV